MREINIGEQTVRVRATPLALLFYKQEFHTDLLGDLTKMEALVKNKDGEQQVDPSKFDMVAILQMVWAMAKADAFGKPFPSFMDWLASLDGMDLSDPMFLVAALEEAAEGFFRGGAKAGAKAGQKQKRPRTNRN